MFKKVFVPLLVVTLVIMALAACGKTNDNNTAGASAPSNAASGSPSASPSESPAANKKTTVGYVPMDAGHPYFVGLITGMKKRAEELGIELTIQDPKWDAAKQVTYIENYIAMGVDAIITSSIDSVALEPVIQAAKDKGITTVSLNQIIPNADAKLAANEYEYGKLGGIMAGQWIVDHLNGEAEVALLTAPDLKDLIDRTKGLEEGILSIAPKAKIVANQAGNTIERGMAAAETILQAHPKVKVFAGINDAGALGAYEAIKSANKLSDDMYVGGMDATEEAIAKMKIEGSVYRGTIEIGPVGVAGAQALDLALKVMKDGPIPDPIYMDMIPLTQEEARKR